ncbi:gamma-glutamylcyclotransferase family protein [Cellvibrio mixtus]|uniref:gamma-glutamylcyclotransferase family protein n=1 Tax=Cellvibrio mixtus TaxID=39650 RepID=UPI00058692C8|nr:gamma-glutamylcyclotransferase family protein [Cellvibrio mixtus]
MNPDLLFVYGTLRRACPTGAHQKFLADAGFIANAQVRGKLYRVSYYPALVLEENAQSAQWVKGEVYKLASPEQLRALDAYEECDFPAAPEQEYQRKRHEVITATGEKLQVWIYAYQHPITNLPLITSGDFLNP